MDAWPHSASLVGAAMEGGGAAELQDGVGGRRAMSLVCSGDGERRRRRCWTARQWWAAATRLLPNLAVGGGV